MFEAIRERQDPDVARRVVELYEFIRDEGARPSFGTGANPSVTIWLGERADPEASNPIAMGFYPVNAAFARLEQAAILREVTGRRRGRLFVYDAYLELLQAEQ